MSWLFRVLVLVFVLACVHSRGDDVSLGTPTIDGTGCRNNTVAAVLSPDGGQLSVLFDEYTVEASGEEKTEQKHCNIHVPIHIPSDVKISIFQMDFRGYTSLPKNAKAVLNIDHDFFGNQGPKTQEVFEGERDAEFIASHQIAEDKRKWSKCGEHAVLRIRSSIKVKTNKKGMQALATVDSADLYKAGMKYRVKIKKCEPKEPKNPKVPR